MKHPPNCRRTHEHRGLNKREKRKQKQGLKTLTRGRGRTSHRICQRRWPAHSQDEYRCQQPPRIRVLGSALGRSPNHEAHRAKQISFSLMLGSRGKGGQESVSRTVVHKKRFFRRRFKLRDDKSGGVGDTTSKKKSIWKT